MTAIRSEASKVLDLNHRLIASGKAEWVVVDFHKSIDVVDVPFGVAHPVDVVQAPLFQDPLCGSSPPSGAMRHLACRSRHTSGLLPTSNRPAPRPRHRALPPCRLLYDIAIGILDKAAVQSLFNRLVAVHSVIGKEGLGLFGAHIGRVEVDGTGFHQAFGGIELNLLGSRLGSYSMSSTSDGLASAKPLFSSTMLKVSPAAFRHELGVGIVVVNAVGEPHPLGKGVEPLPPLCGPVSREIAVCLVQHVANAQVVAVVLVIHHVATAQAALA